MILLEELPVFQHFSQASLYPCKVASHSENFQLSAKMLDLEGVHSKEVRPQNTGEGKFTCCHSGLSSGEIASGPDLFCPVYQGLCAGHCPTHVPGPQLVC